MKSQTKPISNSSLLAIFLRFSTGLKWMVGMGQTICMGSASTRHEFFLSQPAPSRYNPRTKTPSWTRERQGGGGMSGETRKKREGAMREGERYKQVFGGDILHTALKKKMFMTDSHANQVTKMREELKGRGTAEGKDRGEIEQTKRKLENRTQKERNRRGRKRVGQVEGRGDWQVMRERVREERGKNWRRERWWIDERLEERSEKRQGQRGKGRRRMTEEGREQRERKETVCTEGNSQS